jgi:hypothetical protein
MNNNKSHINFINKKFRRKLNTLPTYSLLYNAVGIFITYYKKAGWPKNDEL